MIAICGCVLPLVLFKCVSLFVVVVWVLSYVLVFYVDCGCLVCSFIKDYIC